MTAAALGVAALLHASAMAFQMVKFAGVAYLLFMAYRMMKDKEQFDPDQLKGDEPHKKTAVGVMRDGILLNLLNPKLSISFWRSCHSSLMSTQPARWGTWLS